MTQGASNKPSDLIAAWSAPIKGVVRGTPTGQSPQDSLFDSSNVLWREGSLQVRPGLTALDSATTFTGRPTGAFNTTVLGRAGAFQEDAFQADAFQFEVDVPGSTLVVGTTRQIYAFLGGVWTNVSGPSMSAEQIQLARFTAIEIAGSVYILHTNGSDAPLQWDGVSSNFVTVSGSPPKFTDWTTAANRVVGILPPFTVRWSQQSDIGTWPALNFKSLSDTPDQVVAIRNLGTLGFVVYKKRSIWMGVAIGGSDAGAYRFEFRGFYEGPASPAAIIDADGVHVYMTNTGRVAVFDGAQHNWIGEAVYPVIRTTVDQGNMGRAWGTYQPTFREAHFFYPRVGDSGLVKGILSVTLTTSPPGLYPGSVLTELSTGTDKRLEDNVSIVFTSGTGGAAQSFVLDGANDAGVEISGFWQRHLQAMKAYKIHHASGVAVLTDRGHGYGGLTLKMATSQMVTSTGGDLSETANVDLINEPVYANVIPPNVRARWMAPRYEFSTPLVLRYVGSLLYGAALE